MCTTCMVNCVPALICKTKSYIKKKNETNPHRRIPNVTVIIQNEAFKQSEVIPPVLSNSSREMPEGQFLVQQS